MPSFKNFAQRAHLWLKAHGDVVAVLGLISGTALGIGIPIWQTYWIDTPKLAVEIYAIDRQVSADARIPPDDDAIVALARGPSSASQILSLEDRIEAFGPIGLQSAEAARVIRRNGYTPKEAADLISRGKQELKSLPERIEERQKQSRDVDSLSPERITLADVNRLNNPINNEFKGNMTLLGASSPEGAAERQRALDHFRREYSRRLDLVQKRYSELQAQLPIAERRVDELKKDLEDRKGFFQITAILSNAGRKSISIRQLALLRVYIGKGNYVDLKLSLKDYQTNAEIGPNGTRIATFTSDLLDTFPDADRALISTYWGQSVHGILFAEDISGLIHSSNRISFAKGLYQKVIFDRLTSQASKEAFQSPRD